MSTITVRKLDLEGREFFAYEGKVIGRTPTSVTVEAAFTRFDRLDLGYVVFERGDRFVERFYADRWYNVFEVHAAATGELRGWYCNITRPAVIEHGRVSAVDLALDVWVNPDGSARVLDEDEFAALPLSPQEVAAARAAVDELKALAARRAGPFAGG
jgi:hypothetical protein